MFPFCYFSLPFSFPLPLVFPFTQPLHCEGPNPEISCNSSDFYTSDFSLFTFVRKTSNLFLSWFQASAPKQMRTALLFGYCAASSGNSLPTFRDKWDWGHGLDWSSSAQGTVGELLWTRQWNFGFHKMRGISWLDGNR